METVTQIDSSDALGSTISAVAQVLSAPVLVTRDIGAALDDFEAEHCFNAMIQPAFTAQALREFVRDMPPQVVHEIEEPLGMAVTVVRWDHRLLVIGPYTHEALYPGTAEELLRRLSIPAAHLAGYKLYRTRYPIVDGAYAHRAATAALRADGAEDAGGTLHHTLADGGTIGPGLGEAPQSGSFAVIDERYQREQQFMDAVADGSAEEALDALQKLSGMPRITGYLNTPFLGVTILRIMARVAAQRGGLPPVTIDAISQEYAQRLHRIGHSSDPRRTSGFTAQMVTAFCESVRRHRQRDYPAIVRRATDEIDLHLGQHISPADLAAQFGVSTSTLARRFKDATGTTVAGYVAHRRAERAARLLATTSQPIREIAEFVGYSDANYFVKVFRGQHGMTPTAYREAHAR